MVCIKEEYRETNEELLYFERIMKGEITDDTEDVDEEIGYVVAPIDSLGPPGRWIRHKLLESILYGTPVLLAIQHLRNKHLTRFMKFASLLGTEEFYALLLTIILWIVDIRLGRLICIGMAVGFYVANSVKNCLCLPRPPSPPCKPLEDAHYTWGLPSHHSVLGVICPWYIWFYCYLHYHLEFMTMVCLFMVITTWSCSVLFCRIYLGVHSPADVVTGGLLGCIIVTYLNRYDNLLDISNMLTGQGALMVPLYGAILLFIHPFNEIGFAAFAESTSMVSVAAGVILGRAASYGRSPPLKAVLEMYDPYSTSLFKALCVSLGRFIVGAIMVVIVKAVLKVVANHAIGFVLRIIDIKYYSKSQDSVFYTGYSKNYRIPPIFANKKKESEEEEDEREKERLLRNMAQLKQNQPWNIKHAVGFVTYIGMGFTAYYCNPILCQYIGLVL